MFMNVEDQGVSRRIDLNGEHTTMTSHDTNRRDVRVERGDRVSRSKKSEKEKDSTVLHHLHEEVEEVLLGQRS